MKRDNDSFRELESATEVSSGEVHEGRTEIDFSGYHWQMERMRPGQGVEEGFHLQKSELSGTNFSWNFAHVPGDVYTDLYRAGEIEDPFFGRNMAKIKWVQDYEWWYIHRFNVNENLKGKHFEIVFEGVDFSFDAWLNSHYLGHHEGMFSKVSFDVSDLLDFSNPHVPSNIISIKLDPPPKNQKNFAGMKHNFAGDYLTGVIPFGIWQPVKLIATGEAKIENYRLETKLEGKSANVNITCDVINYSDEDICCELDAILKNESEFHKETIKCTIKQGSNKIETAFEIENPKLWWPMDLGDQDRYDLTIILRSDDCVIDNIEYKVGLREIQMKMNPGFTKDEAENPWTFVINGKEMFLRSACWGGQPSFFYGMNSRKKYRYFLEEAKKCNINNLRIFGWHPPEDKDFYDICDELGLTVWTNFPFATQEFSNAPEYLDKVYHEVSQTVLTRRNHPSTLMWMGGEEVFFSEAHVHSDNRKLMEKIGEITKALTNVPYADASPLSSREAIRMGYKTKESAHANSHYYAAGAILMEDFYPSLDYCIIPELTAASSPSVESLKKFIPKDELWPMGLSWGYHAGDMFVLKTLNYEVFGDTCMQSLEEFVTATQIAQGTIFQFALEHFRRCKPCVSGVALCHFLTNWPMIKWDLVDYYGKHKLSYDFVKRSYQPLLPSMQFKKRRWLPNENFKAKLWIINDYYKEYKNLELSYKIISAGGEILKTEKCKADIGQNTSQKVSKIEWNVKGDIGDKFTIELSLERKTGEVLSQNSYDLLIANQDEAKEALMNLYKEGRKERDEYGRGYYRYNIDYINSIKELDI